MTILLGAGKQIEKSSSIMRMIIRMRMGMGNQFLRREFFNLLIAQDFHPGRCHVLGLPAHI